MYNVQLCMCTQGASEFQIAIFLAVDFRFTLFSDILSHILVAVGVSYFANLLFSLSLLLDFYYIHNKISPDIALSVVMKTKFAKNFSFRTSS